MELSELEQSYKDTLAEAAEIAENPIDEKVTPAPEEAGNQGHDNGEYEDTPDDEGGSDTPDPDRENDGQEQPTDTPQKEKKPSNDYAKNRKQQRADAQRLAEENAYLKGLLQAGQQPKPDAQPQPQPQPRHNPDPDLEFEDWVKVNTNDAHQGIATLAQRQQALEAEIRASKIVEATKRAEDLAISSSPEYVEQKSFLEDRQYQMIRYNAVKEMKLSNPGADDASINRFLDGHQATLKAAAKRTVEQAVIRAAYVGEDLAKEMEQIAGQYGYQGASRNKQAPNGKLDLEAIGRNNARTVSLNGTPSRGKAGALTVEEFVDASIEDLARLGTKALQRTLGGG